MDTLLLARLQFAFTSLFHFLFVPLTIGLSLFIAILETAGAVTGRDHYARIATFWGRLFLINFAIGVVTGIVMEFQFGMNWSAYSRFIADILGPPLVIEALLAFFVESTFLGIWMFGRDKLPKGIHVAAIWMVAIGSTLSGFWILAANSFMQSPVGFRISPDGTKAELVDFLALLFNPGLWQQFPHVLAGSIATAGFFVLSISTWHLTKGHASGTGFFERSLKYATLFAFTGSLLVILAGHSQMQHLLKSQPMKVAAAEALWESENPASFSLFTIGDEKELKDVFSLRVPKLLSFLAYNSLHGEVKGIRNLQEEYVQRYGNDDYIPSVITAYWSFRLMAGSGVLMLTLSMIALYKVIRDSWHYAKPVGLLLRWSFPLPWIAHTSGWILAENGRQPWLVTGVLKTADGITPANVADQNELLFSLLLFLVLCTGLAIADFILLKKYAWSSPAAIEEHESH